MKKLLTNLLFLVLLSSSVLATAMQRELPSSVAPSDEFIVYYRVIEFTGEFGYTFVEDVTGGCTPTHVTGYVVSPVTVAEITYHAPSSGTCTFKGNYWGVDDDGIGDLIWFPDQSITVGGGGGTTTSTTTTTTSGGGTTTTLDDDGNGGGFEFDEKWIMPIVLVFIFLFAFKILGGK